MTQYIKAQEQQILLQKVEIMPGCCVFSAFLQVAPGEIRQKQRWHHAKYLISI